jgi:hypothetical protein
MEAIATEFELAAGFGRESQGFGEGRIEIEVSPAGRD